jgi:hypothetical protein
MIDTVKELEEIRNRVGIQGFATALRMIWPNLFYQPDGQLAEVGNEAAVVDARTSKEQ